MWEAKPTDYPLVAAEDQRELNTYLRHLNAQGLVSIDEGQDGTNCCLTIPAWQALEPLLRPGGIPGRCFVAMWFSEETRAAYESGIEPAVSDAGFKPIRIDRKEHNNEIPGEIIAEIRNCQFVGGGLHRATGGGILRSRFRYGTWPSRDLVLSAR
jgi:hypothetical protein